MEQNDRLEKNKDFFQRKQLFNTKPLPMENIIEDSYKLCSLLKRAELIEETIEQNFVDSSGKIRSAINRETMEQFVPGFFDGMNHIIVPGYEDMDYADFISYEDVGMVTGAFLSAMCWKYKVTGKKSALDKARRSYLALKDLYELSQEIAPGFFCKCWGNRLTDELSSDQYIYTMTAFDLYSQYAASEKEKDEIANMIGAMAIFWKKRDYSYKYYGHPLQWKRCRFTGFMALAYHHTEDREFLDELNRLMTLEEVRNEVPFNGDLGYVLDMVCRKTPEEFEKELPSGVRVAAIDSEHSQSGFLSIEPVLRFNLIKPDFYLNMASRMLDYGKRGVAQDGSGYYMVYIDINNGKTTEIDRVLQVGENVDNIFKWKLFDHIAPVRRGTMVTCMFARAAVAIHKYLPELKGMKTALDILSKISPEHMTWYEDPQETLPEDLQWITKPYSGDAITHWLWAYWEAKATSQ